MSILGQQTSATQAGPNGRRGKQRLREVLVNAYFFSPIEFIFVLFIPLKGALKKSPKKPYVLFHFSGLGSPTWQKIYYCPKVTTVNGIMESINMFERTAERGFGEHNTWGSLKNNFTFWGAIWTFSALLLRNCYKKQETQKVILKQGSYIYLQGTYTPQGGTEKSPNKF